MLEILREFFGFGGYKRSPDGAYSFPHLSIVIVFMGAMVALAIILGLKNKNKDDKIKLKPIIWSAILIDSFEIIKIIIACIKANTIHQIVYNLPLFLCSIQLIVLPLAAFSKGRIRQSAIDFVFIFGLLGGVLGVVGAAQNYNAYPAYSWDNIVSAITHSISGFASLYICLSKLYSLKMKNFPISIGILLFFVVCAFIANELIPYNYMFLKNHDGTPYSIFYNMVNGNKILYPMIVNLIFILWISGFYLVKYFVNKRK